MQMHTDARRLIAGVLLAALPLVAESCSREPSTPAANQPAPPKTSGLELSALNRSVDACTDFYQFACGGWLSNNPIPADRPRWGRFDELQERNLEVLRRILEAAAKGADPSSRKIGDYYATCMDEATINARGVQPLEATLQQVAALGTLDQLAPLVAAMHTIGVDGFFSFSPEGDFKDATTVIGFVDQGGMGLPDRDYYFRSDPRSAEIRRQYVEHVARMMALAGASPPQASAAAATVMRLETSLAKAALDLVSRRDPARVYHKLTMAELQALTPRFDWSRYFQEAGAPQMAALNVTEPDFVRAMGRLVASTPLDDLKTYLRWHVVHANAAILSAPLVDENFRFYSTVLSGVQEQRPRWKRCVGYVDADMGEALGQAFVKETFGPRAKADMLTMVADVEGALERDIQALDWMTPATKAAAATKLHAIANKIGYPDKWRDYTALKIERGDALGNSLRSNAFEFHRQMNRIGKPLDKSEWTMTPPTVNAYYHPLQNNINFPAGILQPPFYSADRDAAVNYGGAGAVIGHELTHGFDDQGRQFDAQGNLNDWWTPADAKAFEQRASCFVDEYAAFTAIDDVKLNGKLTLGENTADNGGVRIALMAYLASNAAKAATAMDGFTPEQRFFIGYAQLWCENRRPEFERLQAQTNPHSPGRYRVNGVITNMPEFQKAFSCPAGAAMVRQPACRVW
jgi:endothelin-converting enzyme/putative endopeptidase